VADQINEMPDRATRWREELVATWRLRDEDALKALTTERFEVFRDLAARARTEGVRVEQMAEWVGVAPATVYRALQRRGDEGESSLEDAPGGDWRERLVEAWRARDASEIMAERERRTDAFRAVAAKAMADRVRPPEIAGWVGASRWTVNKVLRVDGVEG